MVKTILDGNLEKIQELQGPVQLATIQWVNRCFSLELRFKIISARRTAQHQNRLWQQGRDSNGKIIDISAVVTYLDGYTKKSKHQDGLAVDVLALGIQ